MLLCLAVERGDIDPQFPAPVVDAIPVERALLGGKHRFELLLGGNDGDRIRSRIFAGHQLAPEMIVEPEIEDRAVHVEQHGIDR